MNLMPRRMTDWPCPPPITTTFSGLLFIQIPLIAVFFITVILDLIVIIQEIRDRNGAMLAAGTANRYGEVIFAFLDIFGKRVIEEFQQPFDEFLGFRFVHDVMVDLRIVAGIGTQLDFPIGIGEKAHVDHQIGVQRHAMLIAKRDKAD